MVDQVQSATVRNTPAGLTQTPDPQAIAARIVAENGGARNPNLVAIKRLVDAIKLTDQALGAQVLAEVERAIGAVRAGELARTAYTVEDGRGTSVTFQTGAPTIEQYRAMPAGSDGRENYMRMDRAFGDGRYATDDSARISAAFREMQLSGLPLDRFLAARQAEEASWTQGVGDFLSRFSPAGRVMEAMQPVVASLARDAGLGDTAWGAHLQRVLDTPGTARAFNGGVATGMVEGAKDFVVSIASLAGRAVQHGNDNSLAGNAGDQLRRVVPEGVKDWLRGVGVAGVLDEALPSAQRGAASTEALGRMGGAVADYLQTRTPGQVSVDVQNAIGKIWSSVQADHAAAQAKGPEAEARWWGNLVGRATFEVASTFVPVAGVAGKITKGANAADNVADALRVGDAAADALRTGGTVDRTADAARLTARIATMTMGELVEGLAKSSGNEAVAYANRIAELSTHSAGAADRVVLGKWPGYIDEAKAGGGRWYETAGSFYDDLKALAGPATSDKAWLVNEAFLRQQLSSGVRRIEVTPEGVAHALARPDSFTAKEIAFLTAEAGKFGYVRSGAAWVRP